MEEQEQSSEAILGATAGAGNVYVFNIGDVNLNLILNGNPAGSVAGWSQGYRPNAQPVPRAPYPGPGAFGNGGNMLLLQWADGGQGNVQVNLDGSVPLYQDLLLFVARNQWQLVDPSGRAIANGQMGGAPMSGGGEMP